eukprot:TRINITY_DN17690_c0_g1_i1.p1 TRINITY_DN17690_c0_g1~~TRINITY_DN17690_c0_g1_i1.p1  ORF type:complete len:268 (+),score=27.06 TRINITY_DN17690_c0_g1_i1:130-933(+)
MNKVELSMSSRRTIEILEEIKSVSEPQPQHSYSNQRPFREPTRNELLKFIKSRGLEEDAHQFLYKDQPSPLFSPQKQLIPEQTLNVEEGINLRVKLLKGDCFYDYEGIPCDKVLKCEVALLGQRVSSKEVAASIMPAFNSEFVLRLAEGADDLEKLVILNAPLSLVLIEESKGMERRNVISVKRVDWRRVLCTKNVVQEIIFNRLDLKSKYPVGSLDVTLNAIQIDKNEPGAKQPHHQVSARRHRSIPSRLRSKSRVTAHDLLSKQS